MNATPALFLAAALLTGCGPAAAPAVKSQDSASSASKSQTANDDQPKQLSQKVPEGIGPEVKPLADGGESYTLRLKLKPGDKVVYQFRNRSASIATAKLDKSKIPDGKWEDASFELDGTQVMKVVEFKDGYFKIDRETKNEKASGTGFGKEQAVEMLKSKEAYRDSIQLSERNSYPEAATLSDPFTNGLNGVFPEKPVKVGDSWEFDAFRSGKMTRAVFKGLDEVQGVKCFRIELKFPPLVDGADDRMWVWFNSDTGVVEKAVLRSVSDLYGIDTYTVHSQWRQR
jgi:hypothetical protein